MAARGFGLECFQPRLAQGSSTSSRVLYQSKPPPRGSTAFIFASSLALVASPVWSTALLGWAGYRAAANDGVSFKGIWNLIKGNRGNDDAAPLVSSGDSGGEDAAAVLAAWDAEKTRRQRRWGIFLLLAILAYWPANRWRAFHQSKVWSRIWFSHLGVTVAGPPSLPAYAKDNQLIYAFVPHGIFPWGLGFACLGPLREKVFHIKSVVVATATTWVPVLRHVIGFLGGVDASAVSVDAAAARGETLAVAPGGIAEMFWGFPRPGCGPDEE